MPKVDYEWVVERLGPDGEEILDTSYWPESELASAKEVAADWRLSGPVDFGLCRHVGDDVEGEIERHYAYVDAKGRLPERFEDGPQTPQRLLKQFVKSGGLS